MDLGMTDFYLLMFSDCGEADYSDQIPPLYPPEMSPFVAVKQVTRQIYRRYLGALWEYIPIHREYTKTQKDLGTMHKNLGIFCQLLESWPRIREWRGTPNWIRRLIAYCGRALKSFLSHWNITKTMIFNAQTILWHCFKHVHEMIRFQ